MALRASTSARVASARPQRRFVVKVRAGGRPDRVTIARYHPGRRVAFIPPLFDWRCAPNLWSSSESRFAHARSQITTTTNNRPR